MSNNWHLRCVTVADMHQLWRPRLRKQQEILKRYERQHVWYGTHVLGVCTVYWSHLAVVRNPAYGVTSWTGYFALVSYAVSWYQYSVWANCSWKFLLITQLRSVDIWACANRETRRAQWALRNDICLWTEAYLLYSVHQAKSGSIIVIYVNTIRSVCDNTMYWTAETTFWS